MCSVRREARVLVAASACVPECRRGAGRGGVACANAASNQSVKWWTRFSPLARLAKK